MFNFIRKRRALWAFDKWMDRVSDTIEKQQPRRLDGLLAAVAFWEKVKHDQGRIDRLEKYFYTKYGVK